MGAVAEALASLLVVAGPSEPRGDEPSAELPQVRWWAPWLCRFVSSVVIGGRRCGARCQSRGCIDCHGTKLSRMMDTAALVRADKQEQLRTFVLSPRERVQTREDVAAFLSSVRACFREWEQEHALGAAWWVAEVVQKPEWERTSIPCPVRAEPVPDAVDERLPPMARDLLARVVEDCELGRDCPLCGGHGTLPGVHLHVHAVVVCPPFWYGRQAPPPPRPGAPEWADFGGKGFRGLLDGHGLGWSGVQKLRSRGGLAAYVSKACRVYLAKVAGGARAAVDWDESQRAAQLAHAVYGRRRHRGTNGRAYGLGVRMRDAAVAVGFEARPVVGECSPAEAARAGRYAALRASDEEGRVVRAAMGGSSPGAVVRFLTVGRRNARRGDYGAAAAALAGPGGPPTKEGRLNLVRGTQVAGRCDPPQVVGGGPAQHPREGVVCVHPEGGQPRPAVRMGDAPGLRASEAGAFVVREGDVWTMATPDGLVVGVGAVASFALGVPSSSAVAVVELVREHRELAALGCQHDEVFPLEVALHWCEAVRAIGASAPDRE